MLFSFGKSMQLKKGDALIVTDIQNDFLPGGALTVPNSEPIIALINLAIETFSTAELPIFITRDWHPENHISFTERGGPWKRHCVQNTRGSEFYPKLKLPNQFELISKGTHPDLEAYSAFSGTQLGERLKTLGVERIWIAGMATDYCILHTGEDALSSGYSLRVFEDAVRGIDIHSGDSKKALDRLTALGAKRIQTPELAPAKAA